MKTEFINCFSRGYGDEEIEAAFAKYDLDGDKVLNQEEQRKMQDDLEGQRVSCIQPASAVISISLFHFHLCT